MRLLLDEMYPAGLADALRVHDVEAVTAAEIGLAGRSDPDVFAAAIAAGRAVLTENVSDFTRMAGDRVGQGQHHHGLLIALSSRFSRRPAGRAALVAAVLAVTSEPWGDRVLFLDRPAED